MVQCIKNSALSNDIIFKVKIKKKFFGPSISFFYPLKIDVKNLKHISLDRELNSILNGINFKFF